MKILQREKNYRSQIGVSYTLLEDRNFCPYKEEAYSIEYYLLDPYAICKVGKSEGSIKFEEIKNRIKSELGKPLEDQMRPKDLLKSIWADNGFGPYNNSKTPEEIAKQTTKNHLLQFPEIVKIINEINI